LAPRSVFNNPRPGFIGFAQRNCIGVAWPAIATQGLIGHFGDVRSAHHHRNSRGPNRIRHAICLGDHSGHGANAHQPNVFLAHELRDPRFVHGLRVAIHQQHLMARWSQRLEQKHPEMWHEIAGYTVIGVVEKDSHDSFRDSAKRVWPACFTAGKKSATPERRLPRVPELEMCHFAVPT
jgi:hypothetical protein